MQKNKLVEALQEVSKLPKDKQEAFMLECLEENLPSDRFTNTVIKKVADIRFKVYSAYIEAGFSEDQALTLCQK